MLITVPVCGLELCLAVHHRTQTHGLITLGVVFLAYQKAVQGWYRDPRMVLCPGSCELSPLPFLAYGFCF